MVDPLLAPSVGPNGMESPGNRSRETRVYPCAQSQQRFWFEEQLHPLNPGLNVAVRWQIDGSLGDDVLQSAWIRLIDRHESLRTQIVAVDGEPSQIVLRTVPFRVRIIDLRHLPDALLQDEADRLAVAEAQTPFDISQAPLLRVTRLVLTATRSIVLVTAHHTVCDGYSIGILSREMGLICAALCRGEEPALDTLPTTYGAFALAEQAWLQSDSLAAEAAATREFLRGYKQFELLPDRPRLPVQTANGAIVSLVLERTVSDALADIARRHGCTMFMASLAALFAILFRYSGESDITLGTQVIGRDEVELEGLVGCFINTVALRADLSNDPTFIELLERTRDMVSDTFDLRHVPLQRLIEIANPKRDLTRNAFFSVNFVFQRSFVPNVDYGAFALTDLPSRSAGAIYDLNFFMVERPDGWRLSCEFNTDLFDRETVEGIIRRLELVIAAVSIDPEQRMSRIPLLSNDERQTLVVTANATAADYPADKTLPELFSQQVARTPEALAVSCGDATLTYAELDSASNRLARAIEARVPGGRERVGILIERSTDLIMALLAVLKSGNAYIPLDPTYPRERLEFIAENSRLALIVSQSDLAGRAGAVAAPFIHLDTDRAAIERISADPVPITFGPSDLAYTIYTSGSTGKPKGVQIEHRSLVNLLWSMASTPGMTSRDVLVAVTTVSFDIAALEMFLPLVTGARLVIAQESEVGDGGELLRLMRRCGATIVQATPITWQLLIEAGWNGDPAVKALCGGEALSRRLANQLLERCSELWNMYGPTETTIWSSTVRLERDDGPVPVGPPIANTQFYVLDANGELVPPRVPGELFIGGDGLARGYFERPDLTAERFVPDPFRPESGARIYRTGDLVRTPDGRRFEFLGRTDHQIKLRGFRIELGEIESALLAQPDITEAVAIVRGDETEEKSVWAFVAVAGDLADAGESWTSDVRRRLADRLPHYMVPAHIVVLAALPRTPNGKIDRNALPETGSSLPSAVCEPPTTPTEIAVAEIIMEMLGRDSIGRRDDIFALGFHSLLAARLVGRIEKMLGSHVPLRAIFDAHTVERLALRIQAPREADETIDDSLPVVKLNANGSRLPFFFLHNDVFANGMYCRRLAAAMGPVQPIYALAPHGTAGLPAELTIEAMARDYLPRLREIQPAGPYRIGGFCAGGLVAYEVARLLREQGEDVERLVLINAAVASNNRVRGGAEIIRRIGLDSRLNVRLRETICYNVARFFEALGESPREIAGFFTDRLRGLLARAERRPHIGMDEFVPFQKIRGTPETETDFVHLVASVTYHPHPYDGEITLVWSMDQVCKSDDMTVGWSNFAKSVHVAPIAGGHHSPLQERIEELGRVLEELLR